MLVLSRKTSETIVIDGRITLEILQIKGNQIRIGINAPADVRILRGELTPYGVEDPQAYAANRLGAADYEANQFAGTEFDTSKFIADLQIANVG